MNTSEQILVIFLSTALAIFLLLFIILLVLAIKVVNNLRHITAKAEKIADKADSIADFFQATGPAIAVTKILGNIVETVKHNRSARKGKHE